MNFESVKKHAWFFPAIGAAVVMLFGLALHETALGVKWEHGSYDTLFRFGAWPAATNVVLVAMDDAAYNDEKQTRGKPWDRSLHAQLLRKLAADKCPLVVFDVFFDPLRPTTNDAALAAAMREEGHVLIMQKSDESKHRDIQSHVVREPQSDFRHAALGMAVGEVDDDLRTHRNQPPRRHYPFPSPGGVTSLSWKAAELSGAQLAPEPEERWLRYYGRSGTWITLDYPNAFTVGPGFYSNKVVFIGQEPTEYNPSAADEDTFVTPYGKPVGGVEIHITSYLNLMRGDWLRRIPDWGELSILVSAGILLGGGLGLMRWPWACSVAALVFLGVLLAAVSLSYYTNYWFDWLTTAGGQLPVALCWAIAVPAKRRRSLPDRTMVIPRQSLPSTVGIDTPEAPDYTLSAVPFASGAYGKVWLARNAIGQWQALKAVYLSGFGQHTAPYDREFNGISRYKPVSEKHSGLLRVDFISQKKPEKYFYYVMELGDSLVPGWEENPSIYKPSDLANVRRLSEGNRLPVRECVRIILALCEALDFLHSQGLTHRDVKPGNIIFVNGQPKLADVGLIAQIRDDLSELTWVGTPAYMPPPPEPPGTVQADIYGLGMVLYVILTGRDPEFFPGVSTTLAEKPDGEEIMPVNNVVLKACNPDISRRYNSAAEMRADLLEVREALEPRRNLSRAEPPIAPDYKLCEIPFGSGAFGNVWLARNAIGQWQALKAVYLSGFQDDPDPYDREFSGISRYKPVSEKHSGLLRIDFISQKKSAGYFYYVMELGDALHPGWESEPDLYQPRDLAAVRKLAENHRLPGSECVRIGLVLCEALEFLHSQGLTHRDVKPANIIFVNGRPKLADVGLVTEIRTGDAHTTRVGTLSYMPPPPERPGTVQADVYGLGMVLYVIRTGRDPEPFSEVSATLTGSHDLEPFLKFDRVILKACDPDTTRRYASAGEMRADLSGLL